MIPGYDRRLTRIVITPSAISGSRISPNPPGATVWNQCKMLWSVVAIQLMTSPIKSHPREGASVRQREGGVMTKVQFLATGR